MRRWLASIVLVIGGCKLEPRRTEDAATMPSSTAPPDLSALSPAQRDELRAAVIAGATLMERPELTPTDPAIVDRSIAANLPDGRFPATDKERAYFLRHATTHLKNWLSTDRAGLAVFQQRIAERYANPVITRDGDRVRVDAGVVAGRPGTHRARFQIMDSPLLKYGQLLPTEVARFLKLGMARYPDARTYQLDVDIPATWSQGKWTYVYDRGEDRIRLYSWDWTDKMYVSEKLGGDPGSEAYVGASSLREQPLDQLPIRAPEVLHKPG